MARNVLRRSNSIQARSLWKFFLAVVLITGLSLVFVFLQIRNIRLADEIKKLEVSLQELEKQNNFLQVEVACRTKPQALQQKMREFGLNLVQLSELETVEVQVPGLSASNSQVFVQRESFSP